MMGIQNTGFYFYSVFGLGELVCVAVVPPPSVDLLLCAQYSTKARHTHTVFFLSNSTPLREAVLLSPLYRQETKSEIEEI